MTAIVRGNAFAIPLADESVDLVVTSVPFFAQRSYRDEGEHVDGQVGDEAHPQEYLEASWAVMAELWRVLKPGGSVFWNVGDKRSGSGAPGTTSGLGGSPQGTRTGMTSTSGSEVGSTLQGTRQQRRAGHWARSDARNVRRTASYTRAAFGRAKSRQGLPERFVIGCMDGRADPEGVGWIYRQCLPWSKPNGMPESVKDRTRDNFEFWYHFTKNGDYYSAVDELREPHKPESVARAAHGFAGDRRAQHGQNAGHLRVDEGWGLGDDVNPRGALPGSVWEIATEPLSTPDYFIARTGGAMTGQWITGDANAWRWTEHAGVVASPWPRPGPDDDGPFLFVAPDHFAAFPTEWPRRLILGWSSPGWCTACSEPRRPVVEVDHELYRTAGATGRPKKQDLDGSHGGGFNVAGYPQTKTTAAITGYACACPDTSAPTRPAVVLDPFGGTGTTAMVARALGRFGISLDLSADYCRLAGWRIFESGHGVKAAERTNRDRQGVLL